MNNLDKYQDDLKKLIKDGTEFLQDLTANENTASKFQVGYQTWYTQALEVVRQIIPTRFDEFQELYNGKNRNRKKIDATTYTLQDWILGTRSGIDTFYGGKHYNDFAIACMRFQSQLTIVISAQARFKSSLFEMKQIVQADLFDSELDAADALNQHGFQRGAGAIAGVVVESHLIQVCDNHGVKIGKKNPGINDLAHALKDSQVIDVPEWRSIQHLADLRNLCDHKKNTDPTKEQIVELTDGAKKLVKSLF